MTGPFVPFAVAALLSLSWIAAFVALVLPGAEEAGLAAMAPVDIASMMAAAIVPVGILWLCAAAGSALAVIRADRRAAPAGAQARRTEDIDTIARTLVLLEEQARRRAFLEGLDLTLKDMSSHLALLMRRLGMIEREEVETLWALYAAGNPWAFPEMLLIRMGSPGPAVVRALAERLANDSPSAAALQRFLRRHAMVCRLSQDQGEDKLLGEILTDGPLGQVAGLLDSVNQRLPGQTPAAEIAPGRAADPAEAPSRPAVPPPFTGPSTQSAPAPSPVPTQAAPRPAAPAAPQPAPPPPASRATAETLAAAPAPLAPAPTEPLEATADDPAGETAPADPAAKDAAKDDGKPADAPTDPPRPLAPHPPYPRITRDEMESIQERVARSLSRTVLTERGVTEEAEPAPRRVVGDQVDRPQRPARPRERAAVPPNEG